MGRRCKASRIVEPVIHRLHDFKLLKKHCDCFGFADSGLALIRARILAQCILEVLRDPDLIHDEPGGLVAEHPIDAGNRLHQPVAFHWLINIHRVH